MDAFIFPGQGSQHLGMGKDLFDEIEEFERLEPEIDALLGYSLRALCLEGGDRLRLTQNTQPALYVVNHLHFLQARRDGRTATVFAGHSLGEYNALAAAGVFDFVDGLRLVRRRGELMGETRGGAMTAVVGLRIGKIEATLRDAWLEDVDIANHNAPTETVVSGTEAAIFRAEEAFRSAGAKVVVRLPVSAAFHSRHMTAATAAFRTFLKNFQFKAPSVPVISNVTGRPYPSGGWNGAVRVRLGEQIVSPVRWVSTIRYLKSRGVSEFLELGPGNVLSRLVQQIPRPK